MDYEEFKNLPIGTLIKFDGKVLRKENSLDYINENNKEEIYRFFIFNYNRFIKGERSNNISGNNYLKQISIIGETKMKTTFKYEEPKSTFPKFMKHEKSELVVLFFTPSSGVVVEGDHRHNVNEFHTDFITQNFTELQNCEVTFSNK